jgi:hypothetical protein
MTPREQLVEALQLMALPAESQVTVLPDHVNVADEVALFLDDAIRRIRSENVSGTVLEIERLLADNSGPSDFWTPQALHTDSRWRDLRVKAAIALRELGEPLATPTFRNTTFIKP